MEIVKKSPYIVAVGVNCSRPEHVVGIVTRMKRGLEGTDKVILCYVSFLCLLGISEPASLHHLLSQTVEKSGMAKLRSGWKVTTRAIPKVMLKWHRSGWMPVHWQSEAAAELGQRTQQLCEGCYASRKEKNSLVLVATQKLSVTVLIVYCNTCKPIIANVPQPHEKCRSLSS
jgi:hypothetical protein